ncbi:tyrosine-type recombinase/integrase [Rhodobacter sp. CZR27]|uniref:tyrosine-type recombinase/integrase n=1 Tax=Rhodobacter sp. CZR27 TaxID=2033869 RepID=UPI000BBEA9B1|nr:tyrosine-type recombinase/integrase [Rhodobacter sp. CZR27]
MREAGAYFDLVEIETLAEACGLKTETLRRITLPAVTEIRRWVAMSKADIVSNALKYRRLSTAARYFCFVGRMSEAHLPKRSLELAERISARKDMAARIAVHRPRIQSSRIRSIVKAADVARVAAFVATGNPYDVWKTEAMARRNWALVCLLVASGVRQGEARQLKPEDVKLATCEIRVERRHDDPEDPRNREPNAKTLDRIVPFGPTVAQALEDYMFGPGSDAAEKRGSPFIFLSHDNHTHGTPIPDRTVGRVVHELGKHLGIEGLTPHHLRHGWIQSLADWAIAAGISAADFARFANFLGGWSYLSTMAAEYRGDLLDGSRFQDRSPGSGESFVKSPTSSTHVVGSEYRQAFASDGTPFDPEQDSWSFRTLSGAVNIDFTMLRESASGALIASLKRSMRTMVATRNLNTSGAAFRQFRNLVLFAHQRRDGQVEEIDAEDVAHWCARGNVAHLAQLRMYRPSENLLMLQGVR